MSSTYPIFSDLIDQAVDDQRTPEVIGPWAISRNSSAVLRVVMNSEAYAPVNYAMLGSNYGLESSKWLEIGDETAELSKLELEALNTKEGNPKQRQRKRLMIAISKLANGLGTREEDRQLRCRVAASLIPTCIHELQHHGANAAQSYLGEKVARGGNVVLPWPAEIRIQRRGRL